MKTRVLMSLSVLAGWMMSVLPSPATTLVSMSLQQLTQASSDIVQAQVVNHVCTWNAAHTQVLTITTVAVSESYKGSGSSTLDVEQMGGVIGNMRVYVPGDVSLQPQEQYVLFLEPATTSARYRLVGMMQGAYKIYQNAGGQQERVIAPPFGQLQDDIKAIVAASPAGTAPLTSFHKYVSSLVSAGIHVPGGVALPVAIVSTEKRGADSWHVYGKTQKDLFPNKHLVIPAGTEVVGEAKLNSSAWVIHWDELNVRGVHTAIIATNQESQGNLQGRNVVVTTR